MKNRYIRHGVCIHFLLRNPIGQFGTTVVQIVNIMTNWTVQRVLLKWSDELHLALVLTTGGTGFSPSDVTPEVSSYCHEWGYNNTLSTAKLLKGMSP